MFRFFNLLIVIILISPEAEAFAQGVSPDAPPPPGTAGCCFIDGKTGLFDAPVNMGPANATGPEYHDLGQYKLAQDEGHWYKDHAPFIEIDPNGTGNRKEERLWFSSSRYPLSLLQAEKLTSKVMQVYYMDRVVDGNLCPGEGWEGKPTPLITGEEYFDRAVKGAVAIAGEKMILSADSAGEFNGRHEYADLWELKKSTSGPYPFVEPERIGELSNYNTWETQPSLSGDGKHLFFVSNREVFDYENAEDYSKTNFTGDFNIYYSYFSGGVWQEPQLVTGISTPDAREETPHISYDGKRLYFASNKDGNYQIYYVDIELNSGGYSIISPTPELIDEYDGCNNRIYKINTLSDERYPFIYYNPENGQQDGILWASNNPSGWGNYDIYGCGYYILEIYVMDCNGRQINEEADILIDSDGTYEKILKECEEHERYMILKNNRYFIRGKMRKQYTRYDPDTKLNCSYWFRGEFSRKEIGEFEKDTSFIRIEEAGSKNIRLGKVEKRNYEADIMIDGKLAFAKIEEEAKIIGQKLGDGGAKLVEKEINQHLVYTDYYYYLDENPDRCTDSCKEEIRIAESIKTKNGGVYVGDSFEGRIIRDTLYFTPCCTGDESDITLIVDLEDICPECSSRREAGKVIQPVISLFELKGSDEELIITVKEDRLAHKLERGKRYKVYGGSELCDTEICDVCDKFILKGYAKVDNGKINDMGNPQEYCEEYKKAGALCGAGQISFITHKSGYISTEGIFKGWDKRKKDTTIRDKIFITKILEEKPPCECAFIELEGIDQRVPYFQTAFWEVNTSSNLGSMSDANSHLGRLTKGFSISGNSGLKDFKRDVTDFDVTRKTGSTYWYESALYPKTATDNGKYSIANARWIELHPNNQYWGVRDVMTAQKRHDRIDSYNTRVAQYKAFAGIVDRNLQIMSEIITNRAIPIYDKLKELSGDADTKLLIEIIAISDEREVKRGWYTGDSAISYNSGELRGNRLISRSINISPPLVDLPARHVKIEHNETNLGKGNVTLSDLRAWFGYYEIYNRIKDDPLFKEYLDNNQVYLPNEDCKTSFDDCKIAIVTCGLGRHSYPGKLVNMAGYKQGGAWDIREYEKYPIVNNPGSSGYYDYDTVRSLATKISIIDYKNGYIEKSDCCDASKTDCSEMLKTDFAGRKILRLGDTTQAFKKELGSLNKALEGIYIQFSSNQAPPEKLYEILYGAGIENLYLIDEKFSNIKLNKKILILRYKTAKEAEKGKAAIQSIIANNEKLKRLNIKLEINK